MANLNRDKNPFLDFLDFNSFYFFEELSLTKLLDESKTYIDYNLLILFFVVGIINIIEEKIDMGI